MEARQDRPSITIITPVYNKAPFLPSCLDAILAQTYQNLEILLIDDASTDESLAICRAYEKRDSRIRLLVMEENVGAANARNRGLDEATGELIGFVDADDLPAPDMMEKLWEALTRTGADVAVCASVRRLANHPDPGYPVGLCGQERLLDNAAAMEHLVSEFPRSLHLEIALWNKLYRRALIGDVRMLPINSEDYLFNYEVFKKARLVVQLPELLYVLRATPESLSGGGVSERNITALEGNRLTLDALKKTHPNQMDGAIRHYFSVISSTAAIAEMDCRMPYASVRRAILAHAKNARALTRAFGGKQARQARRSTFFPVYMPKLAPHIDRRYRAYLRLCARLRGEKD